MKKTIITRSANDKLYSLAKSLWRDDNTFVRLQQFTGFHGALTYLLHILENYNGIIVNADEDFFVTNEDLIDQVIADMTRNDFAYCGVPDKGIISHRDKSFFHVNPFFNVFNVDMIQTKLSKFDQSKVYDYANQCEKNGNVDEPFAGLFYWLHLNFKHANFTKITSTDGTSTVININDKPIGIHSWYSREYGKDVKQTERIDKCLEWAIINRNQ